MAKSRKLEEPLSALEQIKADPVICAVYLLKVQGLGRLFVNIGALRTR